MWGGRAVRDGAHAARTFVRECGSKGLGAARLVRGRRLLSEAAAVGEDQRVHLERYRSEHASAHTHGTCTCVPEQRRAVKNILQAILMKGRAARTPSRTGGPVYELVYCNSAATSTPAAAGTEESTKLRDTPSLVMLTRELAKLDQVSTAARSF